ncbi:hypothetical protein ACFOUV_07665 [Oceanobacillus longus]|uniref:Uncharacterized protein n=1 Tax=Oceanobacillus longus TaxID=930120 RepID=A0ABV8GYL7_9BACI
MDKEYNDLIGDMLKESGEKDNFGFNCKKRNPPLYMKPKRKRT